ncbi:MAG TPA: DUF2461 domain-containing protein [Xylella taiwanensis]
MTTYFTDASFKFLHELAHHNNKAWFTAHKPQYVEHVQEPFLRLITDLQPSLAEISEHYRADPRPQSGSLFRIYRDARFSNDKAPYKTWQGARLFHARRREVPAPSFYIHLQPGESFVGGGIWHPESDTQRRIRQFIFDNPASWHAAAHAPKQRRTFTLYEHEKLVRAPGGFPTDFAFLDDLKHRHWVLWHPLENTVMTGPQLRRTLETSLRLLAPFMDYLCAALDLEF